MAYHERPREALGPGTRATPADRVRAEAAAALERTRRQARLEQARDRMAADVRQRPEDSSRGIRRMLGYDGPARPPRRWEQRVQMTVRGAELVNVDAGPVDPAAASRPGRERAEAMREQAGNSATKHERTVGNGRGGVLGPIHGRPPPQVADTALEVDD